MMDGRSVEWRCGLDDDGPVEWLHGIEGKLLYWRTDPGELTTAVMLSTAGELVQIEMGEGGLLRRIEHEADWWSFLLEVES